MWFISARAWESYLMGWARARDRAIAESARRLEARDGLFLRRPGLAVDREVITSALAKKDTVIDEYARQSLDAVGWAMLENNEEGKR